MSRPSLSPIPLALAGSVAVPHPHPQAAEPQFAEPRFADPLLPDPPLAVVSQYFAATETAPGWARRHTADVLRQWGLGGDENGRDDADVAWDACQVVSELVTNAVQHAGCRADGAPAPCGLTLRLWPDALAVEVWDPFGEVLPEPRAAGPLDPSGRGLLIVAALASMPVAVHRHPTGGKTVVAVLARARAGSLSSGSSTPLAPSAPTAPPPPPRPSAS